MKMNIDVSTIQQWKDTFDLHQRQYLETTKESYTKDVKLFHQGKIKGKKFGVSMFFAVPPSLKKQPRYLICIERIK